MLVLAAADAPLLCVTTALHGLVSLSVTARQHRERAKRHPAAQQQRTELVGFAVFFLK